MHRCRTAHGRVSVSAGTVSSVEMGGEAWVPCEPHRWRCAHLPVLLLGLGGAEGQHLRLLLLPLPFLPRGAPWLGTLRLGVRSKNWLRGGTQLLKGLVESAVGEWQDRPRSSPCGACAPLCPLLGPCVSEQLFPACPLVLPARRGGPRSLDSDRSCFSVTAPAWG